MSKTGAESDHSAGEEQCGAWSHFVRETPDSCGVTDEVEVHFHPQTPSRPRGFPSRSAHRRMANLHAAADTVSTHDAHDAITPLTDVHASNLHAGAFHVV